MPAHTLTREESAQRKAQIVAMRRKRMPFDAIAAHFDISAPRAHELYWQAVREVPNQQVAEHRAEESDLIDRAVNNLLSIAESDEDVSPRTRVEAWSAIRGWCEHKARLLGLNAPTRKEVTVLTEDAVDAALRKLEEEHAEKARQLAALDQRAEAALVELGAEV